jgi:hypothetical protein
MNERPLQDADRELEALLRAAGSRPHPPADVAADVRAAVRAEWKSAVAPPSLRRQGRRPWLVAATVVALAAGTWLVAPRLGAPLPAGLTVARVVGAVELRHDGGAWESLVSTSPLARGDVLRTTGMGRVALRRADGLEVRLDAGTTLVLRGDDAAHLETGQVYVDSGRAGLGAGPFDLVTRFGEVRHVGTQYSVEVTNGDSLAVAVREGSVAVEHRDRPLIARAGELVTVAADGGVTRGSIESHGDEWRWAETIAPSFEIEGRTLDEFLAWAARETGRQLVYASREAAQVAEQTMLKGAIDGLPPEAAVTAVLATTPSLAYRFAGRQLRIEPAIPLR